MSRPNVKKVMNLVESLALSRNDLIIIFQKIAEKAELRYSIDVDDIDSDEESEVELTEDNVADVLSTLRGEPTE